MVWQLLRQQGRELEVLLFWMHDALTAFLIGHTRVLKRCLLILAHALLLLLLLPELNSFRRELGSLAGNLLIGILFLSPLAVIFRARLLLVLMGFRRELGILMGYAALVHGLSYMLDASFQPPIIPTILAGNASSLSGGLWAGLVGILLTLPLLLTSNTWSLKRLGGQRWKKLHRLVYPAFAFIAIHRFFQVGGVGDVEAWFSLGLLGGGYVWLKYAAAHPTSCGWLRRGSEWVRGRYQLFQQAQKR